MKLSDIKKVVILGAGTMGQQIGFLCAMHGYNVALYDLSREILDEAMKRMEKLGSWFISMGRIKPDQLVDIMVRIESTPDPEEAAKDADFINESLPEDPELKARVFAVFNEFCPERTVFTTNTSTLVPSMFAEKTGRPQKFAALHFHDVRTSNVVDVMPHPGTAPVIVDLVRDFAKSIGQIVILLHRENNGYVFNAMLSSLFSSALTLASNGVASVEDIDRSWMGVMHMPIGPFGIMDQVGLSTVWTITDFWAGKTGDPQLKANADFLKQYLDKDRLGFKNMRGFYSYPNPAYSEQGFLSGERKTEE
ncbi:MAG: 3-hydroxyacyl-CoA dehydrogenase [Desulfomonile tiedjei]|uniref:3-hydroxyacyl-CoA dehydrogenase n=1 Tax=Desulfomonile tiedjei TaxID=2358 RepID=A0A9D6V251_9BACT|nr:3-hydroxyacyl-CoA dehydrogenase [Desulfomonile tiedjei]